MIKNRKMTAEDARINHIERLGGRVLRRRSSRKDSDEVCRLKQCARARENRAKGATTALEGPLRDGSRTTGSSFRAGVGDKWSSRRNSAATVA